MASLIPALSEKAKQEITKNINYHPILGTSSTPVWDIIEAFQDLCDLEKYPITWEELFEYLENIDGDIVLGDQEITLYTFEHQDCSEYKAVGVTYTSSCNIIELLRHLSITLVMDVFIIIGDIHGWWEKPQTY